MPSSSDNLNERELIESPHANEVSPLIERHVSFAPVIDDTVGTVDAVGTSAMDVGDTGAGIGPVESVGPVDPVYPSSPTSATPSITPSPADDEIKRFLVHFHEHRLRFDQTYPEPFASRLPETEFLAVLDRIHRELVAPLEASQKRVNKWSVWCFATAPIAVGFLLSPWLAKHAHHHQRLFKNFWRTLKAHLKTINKEVYLARGIEWRIERDMEKVAGREAYNRWHSFRIEVLWRKPVKLRSSAERSEALVQVGGEEQQRRSDRRLSATDPELLAAAAIAGARHESFLDALNATESNESGDEDGGDEEELEEPLDDLSIEESSEESLEEQLEEQLEDSATNESTSVSAHAQPIAIPVATVAANDFSSSPPVNRFPSPPKKKSYAEMIAAVKALSVVDEEEEEAAAGLVSADEASASASTASFAARQQKKMDRFSGISPSGPLAAFSLVDPFAALYESDAFTPLYPASPRSSQAEAVEVDSEVEDLKRKKYRVAPERASRLSKVYSMTETIQPASRRASYVPVNAALRKTMLG